MKNFSPRNLQHCLKGKLSTAEKLRPVEAQYQDEFYRSFNSTVGRGVPIDSKLARTLDGRVDFWIPEKKWAVELLRDHEGIANHCDRSNNPDGQYRPWINSGKIQDWIIIDCAMSVPEKGMRFVVTENLPYLLTDTIHILVHPDPKLIDAVFNEDYSNLGVYDHDLTLILSEALVNQGMDYTPLLSRRSPP